MPLSSLNDFRIDKLKKGQTAPLPVLRFCKSDHHADILVPDIHFQVMRESGY